MQNIKIDIVLEVKNNEVVGEMHYQPSEYISAFYKNFIANTFNAKSYLEKEFYRLYSNVSTDSFEIKYINDTKKLLEIVWKFKLPTEDSLLDRYIFGNILNGVVSQNLPINFLEKPKDRVYGFKYGYKIRFDIHTKYILPNKNYVLKFEPVLSHIDNKYYKYLLEYKENYTYMTTHEELILKSNKIKPQEYTEFYKYSKDILQNINYLVVFVKDKFKTKEIKLKNDLSKQYTTKKAIALAEYYLDISKYEKSKEVIEKVISIEPNNAKAHYIYGIILGYMDDFDRSKQEFDKAKQLGYKR